MKLTKKVREIAQSHSGFPFVGTLFTGIMMTKSGPKTLEYNVRFGDPETETLIPLMTQDTDLAEIMWECTRMRLKHVKLEVRPDFSATVIIAAGGYPIAYVKGKEISLGPVGTGMFRPKLSCPFD